MKTRLTDVQFDILILSLSLPLMLAALFWGLPLLMDTFPNLFQLMSISVLNPLVPMPYY